MKRKKLVGLRLLTLVIALSLFNLASGLQANASSREFFILKGDLHVHSVFSHDSEVPVDQVLAESIIAGYDFISLTEHNTTAHMREDYSTDELLVIAGYEHTTPAAHLNIFGLRSIPRKSAIYTKEEMEAYLAPLRERGGIFQLNHPNAELYYSRFGYDLDFHFIEILNGSWREDDYQTLQDWQQMLVQGRKLIATGGTDAHRNHTVRRAFNHVYVTERSEAAILEGLLAGRNFVTVQADGPIIHLSADDAVMGSTVAYREGQILKITIDHLSPGTIIQIWTNRGLESAEEYTAAAKGTYVKEIPTEEITFGRVELWFDQQSICAYSNPIYIEH